MHKIKVINQSGQYFQEQLQKYEHLLEPVPDHSHIKRRERYISYLPRQECWAVFTMPASIHQSPIMKSRFDNVISAVHSALA